MKIIAEIDKDSRGRQLEVKQSGNSAKISFLKRFLKHPVKVLVYELKMKK